MASKRPQMNKCNCNVIFQIELISLQIKVKIRGAPTKSAQSCLKITHQKTSVIVCTLKMIQILKAGKIPDPLPYHTPLLNLYSLYDTKLLDLQIPFFKPYIYL